MTEQPPNVPGGDRPQPPSREGLVRERLIRERLIRERLIRERLIRERLIRLVLITVVAQLIAGLGVGVIWLAWSPKSTAFVVSGASGGKILIPNESESQIAGDGRFLALTVVVGVIAALATWQLRRARGSLALLLLAAGSLLSAVTARLIGEQLSGGHSTGALNSTITLPLSLHASALLSAQAFVAVAIYVVLIGLFEDEPSTAGGATPPQPVAAVGNA